MFVFLALVLSSLNLNQLFLDYSQKQAQQTRQEYEDALKTYRELAQKNPESYLPDVAQILSNMGLVDYSQNRMEQGGEEFRRALKIYRELAQRNPGTYQPAIAQMLHNLGLL